MAKKRRERERELERRRRRRKKLKKLREKYLKAKSEGEKRKIIEKALKVSPFLTEEKFLSSINENSGN
jgi:hypothetical protein